MACPHVARVFFHEQPEVNGLRERNPRPALFEGLAPKGRDVHGYTSDVVVADEDGFSAGHFMRRRCPLKENHIFDRHALPSDRRNPRVNFRYIVEPQRQSVVNRMARDHHPTGMPIPIRAHQFAEKVDPRLFEVGEVGGVVDDAHGIEIHKSHFRAIRCHGREDTFAL